MPVFAVIGAAVPIAALAFMLIGGWEIQNGRDGAWMFRVGLAAFLAFCVGFGVGVNGERWRKSTEQ